MLDDPEKAKAALARLEAIKAQRLVENKLATFTAYKKQREFLRRAKSIARGCSWRPTASGRPNAAPPRCPII
jgi:hypothetical protein